MLFNSGNPNLVDYTRFIVGDPTTAASTQYTDQEVKDAINIAYLNLVGLIKTIDDTPFLKKSYTDTVKDQDSYTLPGDFFQMSSVFIQLDGKDLTLPTTQDATEYSPIDINLLHSHQQAGTSDIYIYSIKHNQIEIYPTVKTPGTNALLLIYQYSPVKLSADTDAPQIIPEEYHDLIALEAAITLRLARDLSVNTLATLAQLKRRELVSAITLRGAEGEDQFRTIIPGSRYRSGGIQGRIKK